MSDIAIRVENLSKQYRIGGKQAGYRTFREALLDSFTTPVRWMRGERKPIETFWALDNVSFEIKQGEAVGIIGRNGAGKSTLLKILSRITKPTKGRVDLYGRVASLLEVGTGFHSELSGRDNIYLNGAILGMSRREIGRKFDEIVDFSGVGRFLDTPVKHYSSGMYMRLAFAVAAHLEPEILVVDEVLAVGDADFQKKCLGKMDDIARSGRTVLFVSHNMGAIGNICNKAILLDNGRLTQFGTTSEVLPAYVSDNEVKVSTRIFPDVLKRFYIKKISFVRQDGQLSPEVVMGSPFDFEIVLNNNEKIRNLRILVQIFNTSGVVVLGLDSYEATSQTINFSDTDGVIKAKCRIIDNHFLPGRYHVDVVVGEPGEWVDKQSAAIIFEVSYKDVYGTGRDFDPIHNGVYWVNHEWGFEKA